MHRRSPPASRRGEPWLLSITGARWNRWLCGGIQLGFVGTALTIWYQEAHGEALSVPLVVAAVTTYTLYEYLLHRFAFHGAHAPLVVRRGHGYHHREPEAPLAMPFVATLAQSLVLWLASCAVLGTPRGSLFAAAFMVGYLAYGAIHLLVHRGPDAWAPICWLRAVHEVHHRVPGANFGVTTPVWDWVFGTWVPPTAKDRASRAQHAHQRHRAA